MADGINNLARLEQFGHSEVFAKDPAEALRTQQSLLHPDFEIIEAPSLAYGGTWRGLQGWSDLIAKIKTVWRPIRVTPLWTIGDPDGDRFSKMYRVSGTSVVTGKSFDTTVFELWEFSDGLIIRCIPYYFDTHELHDLHQA